MQGPPRTPLSLPRSGQEWRRATTSVRSGKFQPWVCTGWRPCSVYPRTQRLGGEGQTGATAPPSTHDALFQRHQLLFLFLPLLKVDVDERLQLQQVLFHALPVDVLGGRRAGAWSSPGGTPRRRQPLSTSEKRQEGHPLTARVGGLTVRWDRRLPFARCPADGSEHRALTLGGREDAIPGG